MTATEKQCDKEKLVGVVSIKLQGRNRVALDKPSQEAAEAYILLTVRFCALAQFTDKEA